MEYKRIRIHIPTRGLTLYSADTNGVIYNDTRSTVPKGRIKGGYRLICSKGVWKPMHRYIAKAFIPNPYNKPYVNHIDGNKLNNNATNLEWCTHLENMQHAVRTGLWKPHIGTAHGRCTITEADVHRICKRIAMKKGYSVKVFPAYITKDIFHGIKQRRTWKHISKEYIW